MHHDSPAGRLSRYMSLARIASPPPPPRHSACSARAFSRGASAPVRSVQRCSAAFRQDHPARVQQAAAGQERSREPRTPSNGRGHSSIRRTFGTRSQLSFAGVWGVRAERPGMRRQIVRERPAQEVGVRAARTRPCRAPERSRRPPRLRHPGRKIVG